tara:strand:+ start:131 stop:775 length:645 start_codon:yes stop_codon:yes gene_type:complete
MKVIPISGYETHAWLKKKHYAKRIPSISFAFGLIKNNEICGVITYGKPPSPTLCDGVCGKEYSEIVFELNRLCLLNNEKNEASFLVGNSMKQLPKPMIIVSYADTSMGHVGTIYKATNFIYTGLSDKRTEWRLKGSNAHSKTICEQYSLEDRVRDNSFEVVERPRKHRYVFVSASKTERKKILRSLKYKIHPYPQGKSDRYDSSYAIYRQGMLF